MRHGIRLTIRIRLHRIIRFLAFGGAIMSSTAFAEINTALEICNGSSYGNLTLKTQKMSRCVKTPGLNGFIIPANRGCNTKLLSVQDHWWDCGSYIDRWETVKMVMKNGVTVAAFTFYYDDYGGTYMEQTEFGKVVLSVLNRQYYLVTDAAN